MKLKTDTNTINDGWEPQEVAFRITEQGCIRVNAAHLHRAGPGIAAVYVDLHSKRAVVSHTGGGDDEPPSITLEADEGTLHLDETKPRESTTTFDFPEYRGWQVYGAAVGRYTLSVCLVKPEGRTPQIGKPLPCPFCGHRQTDRR